MKEGKMSEDRQISKMDGKSRSVVPGRDRLGTMVKRQSDFYRSLGYKVEGMSNADRNAAIKEIMLAMIVECVELLNEVNWKSWKKTRKEIDLEQARFEVADLMAFLLEAAEVLGMDAESIFQHHLRKVEINEGRQKDGY